MLILPDHLAAVRAIESAEATQAMYPFKVRLFVLYRKDSEPVSETVFVRSPKHDSAGNLAYHFALKWFREDRGVTPADKYPEIIGSAEIITLDNSDWNNYKKEACSLMRRQIRGQDGEYVQMFYAQEKPNLPPVAWCLRGVNFDAGSYNLKWQQPQKQETVEIQL